MSSIEVDSVGTKSRDFKLRITFQNSNHAELYAYGNRLSEQALHLARVCIGGDINILGRNFPKRVPDTTTGKVGDMAMLLQLSDDRNRNGVRPRVSQDRHAHQGASATAAKPSRRARSATPANTP